MLKYELIENNMRNLIFTMVALFATFNMFGQTVESSKLFDNISVGIKGGATALTNPIQNGYEDWAHSIQGTASLDITKMITPVFGAGIESQVGFENGSEFGNFQGRNWLNYVNVIANSKFNLNNLFAGYKGTCRPVEVVAVAGIGWNHGFVYPEQILKSKQGTTHTNDIITHYAIEFNFNLSDKWQLNLVPEYNFNLTPSRGFNHVNQPAFDHRNSWYGLQAGLTYKFKNSNGTHNFKLCPYKYTQEEYNSLMEEINILRNKEPEVEYVEIEKVVYKETPRKLFTISFDYNSTELDALGYDVLKEIPAGSVLEIEGEASTPGSKEYNDEISLKRARVLAEAAKKLGHTVKSIKGLGATGRQIVNIIVD